MRKQHSFTNHCGGESKMGKMEIGTNPLHRFRQWYEEALAAVVPDADAMSVATVSRDGKPATRMVLLKGFDEKGFLFFTNYDSQKGKDILHNPQVALLFFWPTLSRQIRIDGRVKKTSAKESEAYFCTRLVGSQLSAWASSQSSVIKSREVLEKRMEELQEYYTGRPIPCPPYWGGYRVVPEVMEFWEGRASRLHDRLRYRRLGSSQWCVERLAP